MRRAQGGIALALLMVMVGAWPAVGAPAKLRARSAPTATTRLAAQVDVNGDGFDDLAVGVPGEDVADQADAGVVQVQGLGAEDQLVGSRLGGLRDVQHRGPCGTGLTAASVCMPGVAEAGMVAVAVKPLPLVLRTARLTRWPSRVASGFPVGHLVPLMVTVWPAGAAVRSVVSRLSCAGYEGVTSIHWEPTNFP